MGSDDLWKNGMLWGYIFVKLDKTRTLFILHMTIDSQTKTYPSLSGETLILE